METRDEKDAYDASIPEDIEICDNCGRETDRYEMINGLPMCHLCLDEFFYPEDDA